MTLGQGGCGDGGPGLGHEDCGCARDGRVSPKAANSAGETGLDGTCSRKVGCRQSASRVRVRVEEGEQGWNTLLQAGSREV